MDHRTWLTLGLVALVATALAPAAPAAHSGECDPGLYVPPRGTHAPAYVILEYVPAWGGWWEPWIYQESNGRDALQRHDDRCGFPGVDDTNRDRLIF